MLGNAIENPFGPKVSGCDRKSVKYVLGTKCKPCVRYRPFTVLACPARFERANLGFLDRGYHYPLSKRLSFAQFKVW